MPVKMSEAGPCYYSVLGLCKQASDSEIRGAYRKLALVKFMLVIFLFDDLLQFFIQCVF